MCKHIIGVQFYDAPLDREPAEMVSYSYLIEASATEDGNYSTVVPDRNWQWANARAGVYMDACASARTPRVAYFRFEDEMANHLAPKVRRLYGASAGSRDKQNAIEVISALVRGYIQWRFPIDAQVREHGVWCDAPGLETVTHDRRNGRRLGIHIDSWDAAGIVDRQKARTRFSVNLGPDVRHFLWVPYRVEKIVSALVGEKIGPSTNLKVETEDLLAYLRHQDEVPVFRLELRPFEGYIADTDNLFHDASSWEAKLLTHHYTLRSFYNTR